jgi:hypothetical protein
VKGFSFYAAVSAAVAAAATAVVPLVPANQQTHLAAWLGIGLATLSSATALLLKRRAMSSNGLESLATGLKALALVMALRGGFLALGLLWVTRHGDGAMGFVAGFFVVYLGQQWLEISYLMTAQKRNSLSKVQTP